MNKQKLYSIFGIVLFIVAGLLLAYAIWSFKYCAGIISDAKASGQLSVSGNEYDIISFYMGNCAQYFVFALLLAAGGTILRKSESTVMEEITVDAISQKLITVGDDELDDWFEEIGDGTDSANSKTDYEMEKIL